MITVKKFRSG